MISHKLTACFLGYKLIFFALVLSYARVFKVIVSSIKREKSMTVLEDGEDGNSFVGIQGVERTVSCTFDFFSFLIIGL